MISYVKGPLRAVENDAIIIEAGAVGLEIHVPGSVLDRLPPMGAEMMVYTLFRVQQDDMSLYGFLSRQEREMFRRLIGISGIGPKGALGILSVMTLDELRMAILTGDAKLISKAPGIGARTAGRIILDLKDKVSAEDILEGLEAGEPAGSGSGTDGLQEAAREAVQALVALGYSSAEAGRAVKQAEVTESMTAEEVLKASLRYLSF